jgi:DNA topoisomerase-1
VTDGESNASLRRGQTPETMTIEAASEMLAEKRAKGPTPPRKKATKAAKKAPAKKAAAKATGTATKAAPVKKATKAAKKAAPKKKT